MTCVIVVIVCRQEGLVPLSALCLSHSHSAADMDALLPPSSAAATGNGPSRP